jgi:hypothetical protein
VLARYCGSGVAPTDLIFLYGKHGAPDEELKRQGAGLRVYSLGSRIFQDLGVTVKGQGFRD